MNSARSEYVPPKTRSRPPGASVAPTRPATLSIAVTGPPSVASTSCCGQSSSSVQITASPPSRVISSTWARRRTRLTVRKPSECASRSTSRATVDPAAVWVPDGWREGTSQVRSIAAVSLKVSADGHGVVSHMPGVGMTVRLSAMQEAERAGYPDLIVTLGGDRRFLRGVRVPARSQMRWFLDVGWVGFPILGRRTSVRHCCPGRRTHARQRDPEGLRRAGSYIQPLSCERLHSGGPVR
jgi:hypothetical protein